LQLQFGCVLLLVAWLSSLLYLKLTPQLGPFIVVLEEILLIDMPRFLLLLWVVSPPLLLCFRALAEHDHSIEDEAFVDAFGSLSRSMLQMAAMMSSLGGWPSLSTDAFLLFLFTVFMILVPVVLMNILIAMLNDTYSRVKAVAFRTWAMSYTIYAISHSGADDRRFPETCRSTTCPSGCEQECFYITGYGDKFGVQGHGFAPTCALDEADHPVTLDNKVDALAASLADMQVKLDRVTALLDERLPTMPMPVLQLPSPTSYDTA